MEVGVSVGVEVGVGEGEGVGVNVAVDVAVDVTVGRSVGVGVIDGRTTVAVLVAWIPPGTPVPRAGCLPPFSQDKMPPQPPTSQNAMTKADRMAMAVRTGRNQLCRRGAPQTRHVSRPASLRVPQVPQRSRRDCCARRPHWAQMTCSGSRPAPQWSHTCACSLPLISDTLTNHLLASTQRPCYHRFAFSPNWIAEAKNMQ